MKIISQICKDGFEISVKHLLLLLFAHAATVTIAYLWGVFVLCFYFVEKLKYLSIASMFSQDC